MGFFNSRLSATFDWYNKHTKDILLDVPVSSVIGIPVSVQNAGKMKKWGWELLVGWKDQVNKFSYSATFSLSDQRNEIIDLKGTGPFKGDRTITQEGYALNTLYAYVADGFYTSEEEIASSPKFEGYASQLKVGDIKYKDVNGDGEITTADRTMIGNPTPDVTYGFTLGLGYKNWELAVDMMGQGGNQIYRTWDNYNWSQFNFMEQRMDRWHGPGTSNTQPLLNTKHTINNMNSEYYIEDGSFFRIRNVQLAYNFDKTLISRIGMQALKLYVNIQNLCTITGYKGYDPEIGALNYNVLLRGVDDARYPSQRIYTFGLNFNF